MLTTCASMNASSVIDVFARSIAHHETSAMIVRASTPASAMPAYLLVIFVEGAAVGLGGTVGSVGGGACGALPPVGFTEGLFMRGSCQATRSRHSGRP